MQFIQRNPGNSLVHGTPKADRIAVATKEHKIMVAMGHSEKAGASRYKDAMYAQNEPVQVVAWPSSSRYRDNAHAHAHALGAQVNTAASPIHAAEGQCFVIAPCATVSPKMVEMLCGTDPTKQKLLLDKAPGNRVVMVKSPPGSATLCSADDPLTPLPRENALESPAAQRTP